jgi:LmbE family N-acetylglucosaminyl deacetylase
MFMERVLIISPHPDDESIGCGGTILRHVASGDTVKIIFLTCGEKGGHGLCESETRVLRENEARKAAAVLGVTDIEFWQEVDGALENSDRLADKVVAAIRGSESSIVYVPNRDEMHPDHRAAAKIVASSIAILRTQNMSLPQVLLYEVWTPLRRVDVINDITAYIDRKRHAIQQYESQCAQVAFDEAIIGLNRYRGELYSWPEGDYAEVFELMK